METGLCERGCMGSGFCGEWVVWGVGCVRSGLCDKWVVWEVGCVRSGLGE